MSDQLDCVVIGSGAAGIAAATLLADGHKDFLVLEAHDHVGGRTRSVLLSQGVSLELGAQAIHGSRLPTWEYVIRAGVPTDGTIPPDQAPLLRFDGQTWTQEQEDPAMQEVWAKIEEVWIEPAYDDVLVLDALRDSGFTQEQIDVVTDNLEDRQSGFLSETSAREAAAILHMVRPLRGAWYWLVDGYSDLWSKVTEPFSDRIRLSAPVTAIEWSDGAVVVHADGERFAARTAIITASVGALQGGAIEFLPALPEFKREAIQRLRMKQTEKLLVELRHPFWERYIGDAVRFVGPDSPTEWWIYFAGRDGPPILLSSPRVEFWQKYRDDPDGLESFVLADLATLFPDVDIASEFVRLTASEWAKDPWTRGRTSIAPVGGSQLRAQLAAPTPPLFWAGEATRTDGTARGVHGAILSGRQAAIEAAHQLRPWTTQDPDSRLAWSRYPD